MEVQLPIDDKLVEILTDWHENMLWTHLSLGKKKHNSNHHKVRKRLASRLLGNEKEESEKFSARVLG